jgi:hypothetical protein
MAGIRVGESPGVGGSKGQHWLGPIKRLDLGFFIYGKHQGVFRGTEIKAQNSRLFFLKFGIRALAAPRLHLVRFQGGFLEDSMHTGLGKPRSIGKPSNAPLIARIIRLGASQRHDLRPFGQSLFGLAGGEPHLPSGGFFFTQFNDIGSSHCWPPGGDLLYQVHGRNTRQGLC